MGLTNDDQNLNPQLIQMYYVSFMHAEQNSLFQKPNETIALDQKQHTQLQHPQHGMPKFSKYYVMHMLGLLWELKLIDFSDSYHL